MKQWAALTLVIWIFVGAPAFCLAGAGAEPCACEEHACPDCTSKPCQNSHECHNDACLARVCRIEEDELLPVSIQSIPPQGQPQSQVLILSAMAAISVDHHPTAPPHADGAWISRRVDAVLRGLPLLI